MILRRDLPHGRLVGVEIGADTAGQLAQLAPAERTFAAGLAPARRASWIAGRLALRTALAEVGVEPGPLLATDRGAPVLPPGSAGSISHKRALAVALAARAPDIPACTLGVDLEEDVPLRVDISRRVLTSAEASAVAALPPPERHRQVLLRLSAKEALYKALDPFVRRFVSFKEAEIEPHADGSAVVRLALAGGEGPFAAEVRWTAWDGYLLTTCRLETAGLRPPGQGAQG